MLSYRCEDIIELVTGASTGKQSDRHWGRAAGAGHLVRTPLGCHYTVISVGLNKIHTPLPLKTVNVEKWFYVDQIKPTLII